MTLSHKNTDDIWLVIDSRTASAGMSSGISRFVVGITRALSIELEKKRENSEALFNNLRILIIAKTDPSDWMIELVYKHPHIVSYWKSDAGSFFTKKIQNFTWFWSTQVCKKLQNMTGNKIIWFAPANFDRPLFISNKNMAQRVIQIVHDNIPFLKLKGFGFIFKRQFKFLVSRALLKLPFVATVSQHSAQALSGIVKKRANSVYIISDAVDEIFGENKIISQKELIEQKRHLFLSEIAPELDSENVNTCFWVIGIGRNQSYKCWDIALQAIEKLNGSDNKKKICFIRIGADNKEINSYSKRSSLTEYGKIKVFEELNLLILPNISDEQLALLYQISDLLVHPSLAEGFGLPPVEAALSGLPVLFRKGTAIDEHFMEGSLPTNFWSAVDSQYSAVWANQIERLLFDKKDSSFYLDLKESERPRDYILNYSKSEKNFKWETSANLILKILGEDGGIIENILTKK